ncbi:MAG: helix-turn-helix domain-containing protein [Clostridia bacterium]|nr:helix-turn-helix domain-containing protein [Clostridia bacterium]
MRQKTSIPRDFLQVFVRFIIPYLGVMLIPIITVFLANQAIVRQYKEDTLGSYEIVLQNNMELIDNQLSQIEEVVDSMLMNAEMADFFYRDAGNVTKLMDMQRLLNSYSFDENWVKNVYLYHQPLDVVIDKAGIYRGADTYYGNGLVIDRVAEETWAAALQSGDWRRGYRPAQQMLVNDKNCNAITYTQSAPLLASGVMRGQVNVIIDSRELMSLFDSLLGGNQGALYILDDKNELLLCSDQKHRDFILEHLQQLEGDTLQSEYKVDGRSMYLMKQTSAGNGWQVVLLMPKAVVLEKVRFINALLLLIYTLTVLAGMAVCIYITYKRSKEFHRLAGSIGEKLTEKFSLKNLKQTEFSLLQEGVSDLISANESFRSQIEEQRGYIESKVIDGLLHGEYKEETEARAALEKNNMTLGGACQAVLLIRLGKEYRMQIGGRSGKEFVKDNLYSIIENYCYICDAGARGVAVLLSLDETGEAAKIQVAAVVSHIETALSYPYDIPMVFGAGRPAQRLVEIADGFRQAREVVEYNAIGHRKSVLWYDDLPQEGNVFYYPLALETRLYNYAIVGNYEEVVQTLDEIYHENFLSRTLSADMVEQLTQEITSTIIKVQDALHLGGGAEAAIDIPAPDDGRSITDVFEQMGGILKQLCSAAAQQKKSKSAVIMERVRQYIAQHYNDNKLSLTQLSVEFNLNEKYLSSCFKEETGENFSTYLEGLRIKQACRLIEEGTHKIGEISAMVGYANDVTFRRAFKKKMGVSPSGYHGAPKN